MRMWLTYCGLVLALFSAAPARSAVDVVFVEPETFIDAGLFSRIGQSDREITMARLRAHLERLGERHLVPGQELTIEILDVDLAGELRWRHFGDVRILRPVTWPRIKLRYALTSDGLEVATGEELVSDRSYLMRPSTRRGHDALRFEKAMLDDWFRRRFD